MTRIPGKKDDDLLGKYGFRGFPSLAWLDAEGNLVTKQSGRDVEAFQATLTNLDALDDLRVRIKKGGKGSKGLQADLLVAELNLGTVSYEDAKKRRKGLRRLKDSVAIEIDGLLLNLEIQEILESTGRDRGAAEKAGAKFYDMAKKGRVPSGDSGFSFWRLAMDHAKSEGDAKVFEMGYNSLAEELKDEPRAKRFLEGLAEELAEMKKVSAAGQVDSLESQSVVLAVTGMN